MSMYKRFQISAVLLSFGIAVSACQVQKSSNPLSPSVAGPIPGVSITAPGLVTPATGARIASDRQPITLTINNAVTSGVRPISYLFEVASDAGFGTIVVTKADIKPDASGKTSFILPSTLPDKTYFWRVRAQDGANTGAYAAPASFTVYTPVVVLPPQPVSPASGSTVTTLTPKLTFTNSVRSGPAGVVRYQVALFADPFSAATLLWSWSLNEGAGQTSVDVQSGLLADGKTYHWAIRALEETVESEWSPVVSFKTPATTTTPPSGGGGSGSGGGTSAEFAALGGVTIVGGSPDVSGWAATSRITSLRFSPGNIHLEHTKLGQWPGVDIGGALQESTLWVFFKINGRWYATGAERWRPGQTDKALSAPSAITNGWFYNATWAPMDTYYPRPGEQVGFMVVAGSTRADTRAPVQERSNILMVPFPADGVNASFP